MKQAKVFFLCMSVVLMAAWSANAVEEIPEQRAKQIREAAPEKATVTPEESRKVLVWNTPAHLMEKDPHKGYCIPYGAAAFRILGEKTGAYEPVVSDDLAMFLSENIKQFDAIVMNNSSNAWITPTADDMEKSAFRKHGETAEAV